MQSTFPTDTPAHALFHGVPASISNCGCGSNIIQPHFGPAALTAVFCQPSPPEKHEKKKKEIRIFSNLS
jgi:hypothetical protein